MLLMVEKGTIARIHNAIHQYIKAINKNMKECAKNKESSYLKYWEIKNLYGQCLTGQCLRN